MEEQKKTRVKVLYLFSILFPSWISKAPRFMKGFQKSSIAETCWIYLTQYCLLSFERALFSFLTVYRHGKEADKPLWNHWSSSASHFMRRRNGATLLPWVTSSHVVCFVSVLKSNTVCLVKPMSVSLMMRFWERAQTKKKENLPQRNNEFSKWTRKSGCWGTSRPRGSSSRGRVMISREG